MSVLTQSLAICEWLEETHPEPPLLPGDAFERARVRAFALAIACDIHPVQNLKVLARLRALPLPETEVTGWARWVIEEGLEACEALLADRRPARSASARRRPRRCLPRAAARQCAPLRLRPVAAARACWRRRPPATPCPPSRRPRRTGKPTRSSRAPRPRTTKREEETHVRFRKHHGPRRQEHLLRGARPRPLRLHGRGRPELGRGRSATTACWWSTPRRRPPWRGTSSPASAPSPTSRSSTSC